MITYDKDKKELTFKKYDCQKLPINLIRDLKKSYEEFCIHTVVKDVEYLFNTHFSNDKEHYDVEVQLDTEQTYGPFTYTQDATRFIEVGFRLKKTNLATGMTASIGDQGFSYKILQIPVMDTMGRLNTRQGFKVVIPALRPMESVSWDSEKSTFNIACPNANVSIYYRSSAKGQSVKIKGSKRDLDLAYVIQGMLYDIGDMTQVNDVFVSNIGRSVCKGINPYTDIETYRQDESIKSIIKKFSSTNNFNGDMYNLGNARQSLNEMYGLERAIGQKLSRDVITENGTILFMKDHILTPFDIDTLYRNLINVVYVTDESYDIQGLEIDKDIYIQKIPKNCPNCDYLRYMFPEYADYNYIPEDIEGERLVFDNEDLNNQDLHQAALVIHAGTTVFKELAEFLNLLYSDSIVFKDKSNGKSVILSFERSIVGNYMVQLGHLVDASAIPAGRDSREWVYTYNNPTFEKTPDEVLQHMTVHDLMAVLCDICRIVQVGRSDSILNRDDAFFKKLSLVHEQFSKYLRMVFDKKFRTVGMRNNYLKKWQDGKSMEWGITNSWISAMVKDNVLAPVTTHNLLDEMSMLTHANIKLSNVPDKMRHLAMPYFGRICPVETPSGKPLGITNNRAVNCSVDLDGNMKVPYYRINEQNHRPYLRAYDKNYKGSNKRIIHWLTPKDELKCKIVSIQDLEIDDNGYIVNEYVLARIPNIDTTEPFIIERIKTSDLIVPKREKQKILMSDDVYSYCTIVPEQILSLASCTIPFIGADDATRCTYGLAQAKQAIYLKHTEKPRVKTSMYNDMLTLHYNDPILSPVDGEFAGFADLSRKRINVKVGEKTELVPAMPEYSLAWCTRVYNGVEPVLYEKQHIAKGEPLAVYTEHPEPLNIYSRRDCVINKLSSEGFDTVRYRCGYGSLDRNFNFDEPLNSISVELFQNSRIVAESIAFTNLKVWHNKEMKAGDLMKETTISRDGCYTPSRMALIAYIPYGFNHEDGVVVTEQCTINYISTTVHHIETHMPYDSDSYFNSKIDRPLYPRHVGEILTDIYPAGAKRTESNIFCSVYARKQAHGIPIENTIKRDKASRKQSVNTYVLSLDKLKPGDKMSGRHGNKGVVSKVLPNSEAPMFMNGIIPDVILNPLGVPSRMNLGQILELHASFCAMLTGIYINSDSFNGMTTYEVETFMHLVYDYSTWLRDKFVNSAADLISRIHSTPEYAEFGLPVEYIEQMWEARGNVEKWIDCFNRDGTAQMVDPITGTLYRSPVTFGWAYYLKLEQEVELKESHRGGPLNEEYSFITQQPQDIGDSKKGQKLGEMELVTQVAYGASALIEESLNEKSDNISKSYNDHIRRMGYADGKYGFRPIEDYYTQPASLEALINYITAENIKVEAHDSVISKQDFSPDKYTYDLKTAIKSCTKTDVQDVSSDYNVLKEIVIESQKV